MANKKKAKKAKRFIRRLLVLLINCQNQEIEKFLKGPI